MVCKLLCKTIFPNCTASSRASVGQLHLGSVSTQLCNFPTPEPDKIRSTWRQSRPTCSSHKLHGSPVPFRFRGRWIQFCPNLGSVLEAGPLQSLLVLPLSHWLFSSIQTLVNMDSTCEEGYRILSPRVPLLQYLAFSTPLALTSLTHWSVRAPLPCF